MLGRRGQKGERDCTDLLDNWFGECLTHGDAEGEVRMGIGEGG